jgi:hypothetical protein
VSQPIPFTNLPAGAIRAGFESAARTHAAARDTMEGRTLPADRQITLAGSGPVEAAIARAAQSTTIDFNFLLAQAEVESAMNPAARAATSSATGLYQFIESTWLGTMKRHGARFGLGELADQIDVTPSGDAWVADPAQRQAILALRNDPQVASFMAAGLAEDNRAYLMPILGRQPTHAELYLAHFLGAGGAGRFLAEMQVDPSQNAAALFSRAAASNRGIFYTGDGSPRSLGQVMDVIGGKLERALARASDGSPVRFARADYPRTASGALPSARVPLAAPTPYIIADEEVFGPGFPAPLSQPSAPSPLVRPAMSEILGSAFGGDPATAPAAVRRAYERLRALGL